MDKQTLRKVQLVQLEIAKEVRRVCDENNIDYYLTAGTCLGAIRHQGFIPWDDDLDIGMLRDQYEKFCKIAPEKLDPKYSFQNWRNDTTFAAPFGKVRKNGTIYQESKAKEGGINGIYVDIIVYDNAPKTRERAHILKLWFLERLILMKCRYRPWSNDGATDWKRRLFYLPFQFLALFTTQKGLVGAYDRLACRPNGESGNVYCQIGETHYYRSKKEWLANTKEVPFEDTTFRVPASTHEYLTAAYGDYMQLPPEGQRENRHQIQILDFGE
ncbi:MAG: LicD family protein [Clostridia bacterium]|nr:LicD family protein [Clostridia bacterium]